MDDHKRHMPQGLPGLDGTSAAQEWDAVVTADAPELVGDTVGFAVLPDGTIIVDGDQPDGSVEPLADAIERDLEPPYRGVGTRTKEALWSVAARRIDLAELPPEMEGETLEMAVVGGERQLLVDGNPSELPIPVLDAIGAALGGDFALVAERLDDTIWEVVASAL